MIHLINKFRKANLKVQGIISLIGLGLYFLSSYFLEKSYVLSKFPVPYFEQQTSFDVLKMKQWYASMIQEGTFSIYLQTQFIDFVFITSVILAGFALWSFVANLHPTGNFFNIWGRKMAIALPLAGVFDIFENIVSFFMIANPTGFSDALILPYSGFATIKFGFWTIALIWLAISLFALPITRILAWKKLTVAG